MAKKNVVKQVEAKTNDAIKEVGKRTKKPKQMLANGMTYGQLLGITLLQQTGPIIGGGLMFAASIITARAQYSTIGAKTNTTNVSTTV